MEVLENQGLLCLLEKLRLEEKEQEEEEEQSRRQESVDSGLGGEEEVEEEVEVGEETLGSFTENTSYREDSEKTFPYQALEDQGAGPARGGGGSGVAGVGSTAEEAALRLAEYRQDTKDILSFLREREEGESGPVEQLGRVGGGEPLPLYRDYRSEYMFR